MGPGGPGTPGGPQGPPDNTDKLTASINTLTQAVTFLVKLYGEIEESTETVAENIQMGNMKLRDHIKMSDSLEKNIKRMNELYRKKGSMMDKEFRESTKAQKMLKELADTYKDVMKSAQGNVTATTALQSKLTKVEALMKEIGKTATLNNDEMSKLAQVVEDATENVGALSKALKDIGPRAAAIRGAVGMLGGLGIGKGLQYKVDQRYRQVQELKDKATESRATRTEAQHRYMTDRRAKEVAKMAIENPDWVEGGRAKGEGVQVLAQRLFGKRAQGTKMFGDFVAGEAAGGEAAGGGVGAAYKAAMTAGGGGALGGAVEMLETGIMELTAMAPEIIVPLEILIAAVTALADLFETYVQQNKDIERNLGKGGLFTQPGVGAGSAFMAARNVLNPGLVGQGLGLGVTFQRNMELAGGLANAGRGVGGMVMAANAPGATDLANQRPGALGGEFMKGALGEMQRVVMGVSRVAGLTDQEGVANLIKMLDQYRETTASTEEFMVRLNKDTAAAGISTTKYLQIIDDVNSHFDRMNKSLEQTSTLMRDLSRDGSISAETLKDTMEFLTNTAPKTSVSNIATAIFTESIKSKGNLDALRQAESNTLNDYLLNAKNAGAINDIDMGKVQKLAASGRQEDVAEAQRMISNALAATGTLEPEKQKQANEALIKIKDQIRKVAGVAGGAGERATGKLVYGADTAQQISDLQAILEKAAGSSGGLHNLYTGKVSMQAGIQAEMLGQMLGLNKEQVFGQMADISSRIAASQIAAAGKETNLTDKRRDYKELFKMMWANPNMRGMARQLKDQGMGMDEAFNNIYDSDKDQQAIAKQIADNTDTIEESPDIMNKMLGRLAEQNKIGDDQLAQQLNQARGIGIRTQTPAEMIKNVFAPWMTELVHGVEYIAKVLGGNVGFTDTQEQRDKIMAKVPDAIADVSKKGEKMYQDLQDIRDRRDAKTGKLSDADQKQFDTQLAAYKQNQATLSYLQGVQDQGGSFLSPDQEKNVVETLNAIHSGKDVQAPKAADDVTGGSPLWNATKFLAKLAVPPLAAAAEAKQAINNYYFSADVNQLLNNNDQSVGTASQEAAKNATAGSMPTGGGHR